MSAERKLTLFIATSLDGYIAGPGGGSPRRACARARPCYDDPQFAGASRSPCSSRGLRARLYSHLGNEGLQTMHASSPWAIDESGFPRDGARAQQLEFLLRYAVLAPSSHNSQPWVFRIVDDGVELFIDEGRWLRVADADRRELHVSLGCALENLLIAAEHFGFAPDVRYFPQRDRPDLAARVGLDGVAPSAGMQRPPELFAAIPQRHTSRQMFDAHPLVEEQRARLESIVVEPGIGVHLSDDPTLRRGVEELVRRADTVQFADRAWRRELSHWLGRGAFGTGWLISKLARLVVTHVNMGKSAAKRDTELLRSASALGVITARQPDPTAQLQVGQAFQRLWLAATALGIQINPMNQMLQVPAIRTELRRILPQDWGEPQVAFRMGYAQPERPTPRRALGEVLVGRFG